jgi:hypothetical protein
MKCITHLQLEILRSNVILLEYLTTNNIDRLLIHLEYVLRDSINITSRCGGRERKIKTASEKEWKRKEANKQCLFWAHQGLLAKGYDVILDNFTDIK